MPRTRDFAEVIRQKLASDPKLAKEVEEAAFHAHIAGQIHSARVAAGWTQAQLAHRAGTQQSVIARLEDADYYGHSNKLIRRIASALGLIARIELYAKPVAAEQKEITASFEFKCEGWPSAEVAAGFGEEEAGYVDLTEMKLEADIRPATHETPA